jgi:hypothetical protein
MTTFFKTEQVRVFESRSMDFNDNMSRDGPISTIHIKPDNISEILK